MPAASRLLPAAVAVCLSATLLGGGVAVADIRADERRTRVAAERALEQARQETAFREGVRPVAERVYDQVQPLQDAFDAFAKPMPDDAYVRDDVMRSADAASALTAIREEFARLPAPASLAGDKQDLSGALGVLAAAAESLRLAADSPADEEGLIPAYRSAQDALTDGIQRWMRSVQRLLEGQELPPLPVFGRDADDQVRPPSSKGAYLFEVDRVCSSQDEAFARLDDVDDVDTLVRVAGQEAALVRSTVERLRGVRVPESDRDRIGREVLAPLDGFASTAAALDALAAAVKNRDLQAVDQAYAGYAKGARGSAELSVGLEAYGARLCGEVFEVSPELLSELEDGISGPGGDDSVRT